MKENFDRIDFLKILSAIAVVAIHTMPLESFGAAPSFFIHVGLLRYAVPLFFSFSGFLLFDRLEKMPKEQRQAAFVQRLIGHVKVYAGASLLYLPFDMMHLLREHGGMTQAMLRYLADFFWYGSHYHLWFFPALIIGEAAAFAFYARGWLHVYGILAAVLYVLGSLGDMYRGLDPYLPGVQVFFDFYYTGIATIRNPIFFSPIFLFIGISQAKKRLAARPLAIHVVLAATALLFLLEIAISWKTGIAQDHNLYLSLPPLVLFLMAWSLEAGGWRFRQGAVARRFSTGIYIVHDLPLMFLQSFMTRTHSVIRFMAVLLASVLLVWGYNALRLILTRYKRNHPIHHV